MIIWGKLSAHLRENSAKMDRTSLNQTESFSSSKHFLKGANDGWKIVISVSSKIIEKLSSQRTTVDGWNPAPPGMYETPFNNGINYQPQLVRISEPSTVLSPIGDGDWAPVASPYIFLAATPHTCWCCSRQHLEGLGWKNHWNPRYIL